MYFRSSAHRLGPFGWIMEPCFLHHKPLYSCFLEGPAACARTPSLLSLWYSWWEEEQDGKTRSLNNGWFLCRTGKFKPPPSYLHLSQLLFHILSVFQCSVLQCSPPVTEVVTLPFLPLPVLWQFPVTLAVQSFPYQSLWLTEIPSLEGLKTSGLL